MPKSEHIDRLCDLLEGKKNSRHTEEELSEVHAENNSLHAYLKRIVIDPDITAYAESRREEIRQSVNIRINRQIFLRKRIRLLGAAAAVFLLFLLSNYYAYQTGSKQGENQQVTVVNPLGVKSAVVLPDGSKVTLNAGSQLVYPAVFAAKERKIEIQGEGYFEVVHDRERPFIVQTEHLSVNVLGTEFNVNAYKEDDCIDVTLTRGAIELKTIDGEKRTKVAVGQFVRFDKRTKTWTKRYVNTDHHTAWKEGALYFDSKPLVKIARELERHFNVRIHIGSDDLKQTVFSGDFVRGENIEQILQVMTFDKRINYRIEKDQIYIETK